jgi:hypothetical protein
MVKNEIQMEYHFRRVPPQLAARVASMNDELQAIPGHSLHEVNGMRMGEVKAVENGAFQAELDDGEVHWVSSKAVFTVGGGRTTLICNHSGLKRYIVPPP